MARYATFLYGTGVLYGPSATIDALSERRGPSTGQQPFIVTGTGFLDDTYNDDFTSGSLNTSLWTDISSGSGSISTGSGHLSLTTGSTAGSVAGIESVTTFNEIQWSTKINIPPVLTNSTSEVELFSYDFYDDSSNYSRLSVTRDGADTKLKITVVTSGSVVDSYEQDWSTGLSTFKILRWNCDIYFYANGLLVFSSKRFCVDPITLRFFADNNAAAYNIQNTVVEEVVLKAYAVFGDQVTHDLIVVSDYRARGLTPPSIDERGQEAAYAGLVDFTIVSTSMGMQADFYEYFFEDSLTLLKSDQFGLKLSIIDDPTVRTPEGESKGLGGGK